MGSSFRKDLEWANYVEIAWMRFMESKTQRAYRQSNGLEPGWDIHDMTKGQYYEVKWDSKSRAKWSYKGSNEIKATGNLFIEYVNPSKEPPKPTGIMASTSDYWVYVVKENLQELVDDFDVSKYRAKAHLFKPEALLEFCQASEMATKETKRDGAKGGAANAKGWILPWALVKDNQKKSGWLNEFDISDYLSLPISIDYG